MDKPHILVVDDNHINRLFFESALKKLNCSVESAVSGFEAIEKTQQQCFDTILMDIRMVGMDGIETARQIKQQSAYKNTPIIAVSAESFSLDDNKDFVDSLLKPVKQDELAKIISTYSTNSTAFNHQQALEISHKDETIVLHLRQLFITQLKEFLPVIEQLYSEHQFNELQEKLHQLLGSAKICAADHVVEQTALFKIKLKENWIDAEPHFRQLVTVIKNAISSA
ncbi:MAG: response regulator [Marinicella sp.]|nr:response regulator [Xanthomonadales bacterium]